MINFADMKISINYKDYEMFLQLTQTMIFFFFFCILAFIYEKGKVLRSQYFHNFSLIAFVNTLF